MFILLNAGSGQFPTINEVLTGKGGGADNIAVATGNFNDDPFRVTAIRTARSFQTGGSRVFTTPQLISVAETGPERITGEPLAGGRRGGGGNNFVFEGPVMFDELTLQKFGREIERVLARERRRAV